MTPATTTTGWTVSRLAAEGLGDRRALGRALRDIEPSGSGEQGERLYALRDVVRALARRQVEAETARLRLRVQALEAHFGAAGSHATEAESRRRKRLYEAELLELELKRQRGEYAPIFDCEAAAVSFFGGVIQRLDAIPSKIAVDLAGEGSPPGCEEIVRKALHEARGEIAQARVVKATGKYASQLEALLAEFRERLYALVRGEQS